MAQNVSMTWHGNNVLQAIERAKRDALELAAVYVEGEATLRCPVDTGNLRSGISHNTGENEAQVFAVAEYAPDVELGNSRMSAQPFLRPALDEKESQVRSIFAQSYSAAIST